MPEKRTVKRAKQDEREGKSASTQAGEFVREEMEHIRQGKHAARNPKQAIAIGLSKARRSGVKLAPPKKGRTSAATRKHAESDLKAGQSGAAKRPSAKRSSARREVLKREPRSAASKAALSKQAKQAAAARQKRGTVTAGAKSTAKKSTPVKKKSGARASRNKKTVRSSK